MHLGKDGPLTPTLSPSEGERGKRRQARGESRLTRFARSVWSARSLLPLSNLPTPYDSASKLDALQTLRVAVHQQEPSQPASNFDNCSAESAPFRSGEGKVVGAPGFHASTCLRLAIAVWLVCAFCFNVSAALNARFAVEKWTTEDGLPQSVVLAMIQTPDGYLWLGERKSGG